MPINTGDGGFMGPASVFQPGSWFIEKPYLKGPRKKMRDYDTQHSPLSSTCTHEHTATHPHKYKQFGNFHVVPKECC